MKRVLLKLVLLLFPLIILGGYFIMVDPMKIIHETDDPTSKGVLMNDRLYQVRYLEKSRNKYNAFIFGSSRSKAFKTYYWKGYLPADAIPYHMGVNDETLYGIEKKLEYLVRKGLDLKYVFIQLDHRLLSLSDNHEAHIFREHYILTGETATCFYQRFMTAFLKPEFLRSYLSYRISGEIDEKSDIQYLWDPGFSFYPESGDIDYSRMDSAIHADSLGFYQTQGLNRFMRGDSTAMPLIKERELEILLHISEMLSENDAEVKVVMSPNFDQITVNPNDVEQLKKLFGEDNVLDFSGKNDLTLPLGNFYEHKHFKPFIANHIFGLIYK